MKNNMDKEFNKIINDAVDGYIEYIRMHNEELNELPDDHPLIIEKKNEYMNTMLSMGDGQKLIYIGDIFKQGKYGKKDIDMAYLCYKTAIEKGELFGHVCIAQMYFEEGKYEDRLEEIAGHLLIAENNDCLSATGLYLVGNIYYKGLLGNTDEEKAYKYFSLVTDDKYDGDDYYWKACYRLGQIHEGMANDFKEAALYEADKEFESEDDIEKELNN